MTLNTVYLLLSVLMALGGHHVWAEPPTGYNYDRPLVPFPPPLPPINNFRPPNNNYLPPYRPNFDILSLGNRRPIVPHSVYGPPGLQPHHPPNFNVLPIPGNFGFNQGHHQFGGDGGFLRPPIYNHQNFIGNYPSNTYGVPGVGNYDVRSGFGNGRYL